MSDYDDERYEPGYDPGPDVYDDEYPIDGVGFADPGGDSALRAETPDNPRDIACPNCGCPNRLTRIDKVRGYQCDSCARASELGIDITYCDDDL